MISTFPDRMTRDVAEPRPARGGLAAQYSQEFRGGAGCRLERKDIALAKEDRTPVGTTQLDGRLDQGFENGLQIKRRTADDLEHLGSCGLLLQRFGQVARPGLYFLEQVDVGNGDHRLVGKTRDEVYLPLGEWLDFSAGQEHDADDLVLLQQGDREHGPGPGNLLSAQIGEAGIGQGVVQVQCFLLDRDDADR